MPIPSTHEMRLALSHDLKKTSSEGLGKVVNDVPRKTFTAKVNGAILEFAHKQPDSAFWTGVKYYGSGSNSRIRIRRTPPLIEEPAPGAVAETGPTSRGVAKKVRAKAAAPAKVAN